MLGLNKKIFFIRKYLKYKTLIEKNTNRINILNIYDKESRIINHY